MASRLTPTDLMSPEALGLDPGRLADLALRRMPRPRQCGALAQIAARVGREPARLAGLQGLKAGAESTRATCARGGPPRSASR
jgi:hypothetical protein